MGLVTAKLQLSNPREPSVLPIEVAALADTGSVFLCIPEHVRIQLKLETLDEREIKLADGSRAIYPYVGPLVLRFDRPRRTMPRKLHSNGPQSGRVRQQRLTRSGLAGNICNSASDSEQAVHETDNRR